MTDEIPYMTQVGNIPSILSKIQGAGAPPKFTHEFLMNTLGFRGSGDRGIIKLLRGMGFLTSDNTPTAKYHEFRSNSEGPQVLAEGIRQAYPGVFLANIQAQTLNTSDLNDIFKRVSGKGDAVSKKMAATFKALSSLADWSVISTPRMEETISPAESTSQQIKPRLSLHHDVHIHLPASSDVAVYTAIFRALKDELLD